MRGRKKILKGAAYAGLAAVFLVFAGRCSFEKPSAPSWDVQFTIPLINETFTMAELADDDDNLDTLGQDVIVSFEDDIDPIAIGDFLKTAGSDQTTSIPIPPGMDVDSVFTQNDEITMPDSIVVDQALIKSGRIEIGVNNQTGYQLHGDIEIPSLTSGGSVLPISLEIQTGENPTAVFVLDGYRFQPPQSGGHNVIPYTVTLRVTGVQTGTEGSVDVHVRITDIVFENITGYFNDLDVALKADTAEIDIPEEFEGFAVEHVDLSLVVHTGLTVPITLDLWIEALEWRGTAPTPVHVVDTFTGTGLPDTVQFPDNLADFINSQPTRILVRGNFKLGSGLTAVSVNDTDTVVGRILFSAPLVFTLPAQTNTSEVDTLDIDEDARERIRDNLLSGSLNSEIDNHLPLGASVTLFFSSTRADSTLYDHPDLTIGPLNVASAPTSGNPGLVTGAVTSDLVVTLTKDQLELFEQPKVYQGIRFEFSGTGGQMVRIRPSDYIGVRASVSMKINTTAPEEDE